MGFGKDGKGVIITQADIITLSTLANNVLIKQASPLAIGEDFRLIKMEISAHIVDLTTTEVPIHLYVVDDELSVSEIAEAIVAGGPLDRNDRVAREQAERPVFLLGSFNPGAGTHGSLLGAKAQEGIVEKTIRWTFSNPEGWSIAAMNQSGATLTTGAVIRFVAKYFGVWLT